LETITHNDPRLKYPGFYNIYPVKNEISFSSSSSTEITNDLVLDNFYGRVLNKSIISPYGSSKFLNFYLEDTNFIIKDSFRVPYRKIPIYEFKTVETVLKKIEDLKGENSGHKILLRGQTKFYPIQRDSEEKMFLYDDENANEPSFLPSFLRQDFNEYFIYNLWHNLTSLMLHDIGIDLKSVLSNNEHIEYKKDTYNLKNSPQFTMVSLGIAQHYGLPSIGLDLTEDLKVALWFASHEIKVIGGIATINKLEDFSKSMLYIFRCPEDSVFSYDIIKPKHLTNTRPDRQKAWFNHTGWGCSKNQLALNLVCAFNLDSSVFEIFEEDYQQKLFPNQNDDLILRFFNDMNSNPKHIGETKRALEKIYQL
jgi:hypothetical protein